MGGSAAIQSRPAARATALFTPEGQAGQGVRGGVHRAGGQRWQEGGQAKAEQHGHRQDGRPVAGVRADAHGEQGRRRAQQAARHQWRPGTDPQSPLVRWFRTAARS